MKRFLLVLCLSLTASAAWAQTTYTVTYAYDDQGRLTEARYGETMSIVYTYDANSNLLSWVIDSPNGVAVEADAGLPTHFALRGNYPNPFNPTTTIRFDLPEAATVRVEVFDVLGRRVWSAPPEAHAAGFARTIAIDGAGLASGLYLYRVIARTEARTRVETGRMMLVR